MPRLTINRAVAAEALMLSFYDDIPPKEVCAALRISKAQLGSVLLPVLRTLKARREAAALQGRRTPLPIPQETKDKVRLAVASGELTVTEAAAAFGISVRSAYYIVYGDPRKARRAEAKGQRPEAEDISDLL